MLGDKLRNLRKAAGDSQERMGAKLFVAPATICSWEQGRSVPDSLKLLAICQCYQVSADELLGLTEAPPAPKFTPEELEELQKFEDYLLFRRHTTA